MRTWKRMILAVLGVCFLLPAGCFRLLTRPRYDETIVGPSDGKVVNISDLVAKYPELDGMVISARDYMEEREREMLLAQAEGRETEEEYRIVPPLYITIEVWGESELTRRMLVRPDGQVDLPLIGEIQVANRTVRDVKAELAERYRTYLKDPQILLNTEPIAWGGGSTNPTGGSIALLGEFQGEGLMGFTGGQSLAQAIALSGGLSDAAEWRQIRVMRKDPTGRERNRIIICDWWLYVKYGDVAQNIPLREYDVVYVPKHWTWGEHFDRDWDLMLKYMGGVTSIKGFKDTLRNWSN